MPIINGVGFGPLTFIKLQHFQKIIEMHISITKAVILRHPKYDKTYYYYDANAGFGIYDESIANVSMRGSPLLFLDAAEKLKMNYEANFIEIKKENLEHLEGVIPHLNFGYYRSFCEDNKIVIPKLTQDYMGNRLGLLFVDPTGTPDFDMISFFSNKRPRSEILVYLSAGALKREYHNSDILLSDYIKQMDKGYWLVRKSIAHDNFQWTFLLGSNTDLFKSYKSIGFYRLDTKEAQQFFPVLNYSKEQLKKKLQPTLPIENI